jgi:hypothetical protein
VKHEHGNGGGASDRFAGLLTWWGMPDAMKPGPYDASIKRLQSFVSDLQSAYGEAYGKQMEGIFSANEHFARAVQDLMQSRQPADVVAAESALMTALVEEAASQAKGWVELVEKVRDCCTSAAADVTQAAKPAGGTEAPARPPHPAPSTRHTGKHAEVV